MKPEISQLLDELRQVCAQYAKEVPKKRRPWPESVRTRVCRLRFLGVSNTRIAQETGIPVMTLYTWKMPSQEKARTLPAPDEAGTGKLVPVRVVHRRSGLMPLDKGRPRRELALPKRSTPTTVTVKGWQALTVILPSGLRVEGLSFEQAMAAVKGLTPAGRK